MNTRIQAINEALKALANQYPQFCAPTHLVNGMTVQRISASAVMNRSPLSYRQWFDTAEGQLVMALEKAQAYLLEKAQQAHLEELENADPETTGLVD